MGISQALLLMRNLAVNLTSPEFEDHVSSFPIIPTISIKKSGLIQQCAIKIYTISHASCYLHSMFLWCRCDLVEISGICYYYFLSLGLRHSCFSV